MAAAALSVLRKGVCTHPAGEKAGVLPPDVFPLAVLRPASPACHQPERVHAVPVFSGLRRQSVRQRHRAMSAQYHAPRAGGRAMRRAGATALKVLEKTRRVYGLWKNPAAGQINEQRWVGRGQCGGQCLRSQFWCGVECPREAAGSAPFVRGRSPQSSSTWTWRQPSWRSQCAVMCARTPSVSVRTRVAWRTPTHSSVACINCPPGAERNPARCPASYSAGLRTSSR